jgi:hypothetical protein
MAAGLELGASRRKQKSREQRSRMGIAQNAKSIAAK